MSSYLKERIDFYNEFSSWYFKILKDFKFDYQRDCIARDYLSSILDQKSNDWNLERTLISFKNVIQKKSRILIYGCGPSLEDTVNKSLSDRDNRNLFNNCLNLAADGASIFLKEKDIPINGIFTDLDGITKKEFHNTDFMVVHAHGDNIEKLKYFEKDILNFDNMLGTTQVEPIHNVINPGGFTDGDRILFFLRTFLLSKHTIFLIGMDFNHIIGRYSKPEMTKNKEANPIKIKKLDCAIKLIEWFKYKIENEIYFVNSKVESNKFNYLSVEQFKILIFE